MIWGYPLIFLACAVLGSLARYLTRPKRSRLSRRGTSYVVAYDRRVTPDDEGVIQASRQLPRGSHAMYWTALRGEVRAAYTDVTPPKRKKILS